MSENNGEKVGVDLSLTINLGNYNSAKVGFWRETVVGPDETEDEAAARIWEFVTAKVDAAADEITSESE